ncbi:MAG TPA: hypothetical protein VGM98_10680 [Schlesneria sp.]
MPSARGTSVLVVLGITLATATLTIGQPPRAPDQTRPHADKVKYLDRVASLYLCRGMSRAEVVAGLRQHELREVSFGDPGLTMTCFYGSPNLFDPVIFVEFHRDQNQIFRAIGWHIE